MEQPSSSIYNGGIPGPIVAFIIISIIMIFVSVFVGLCIRRNQTCITCGRKRYEHPNPQCRQEIYLPTGRYGNNVIVVPVAVNNGQHLNQPIPYAQSQAPPGYNQPYVPYQNQYVAQPIQSTNNPNDRVGYQAGNINNQGYNQQINTQQQQNYNPIQPQQSIYNPYDRR